MKIYNTMTRQKEEFVPIDENEIKIYVCGPTVYNYFHIGNARPFVVFDTLRRYLEFKGKNVKFVQNFTDVDDKIINRAKDEGISAKEVSEKYIEEYFKDAKALNVKKASVHPKVTETIADIVEFVKTLVERGYAYEIDGDVYYSTAKFANYGKLSNQDIEELEAGARINIEEKKKDPMDFALWKARKEDSEIAWESPWGMGRPGWHIECSAMAKKYLGETIDIHAGGQDLSFPHHENEIAQSEACNGVKFANYWMHNGYITIDNEKMSKSKGNFFTVRDILKEYAGEEIRFFLLSGHYRNPINFSDTLMQQAKAGLARIVNLRDNLKYLASLEKGEIKQQEKEFLASLSRYEDEFVASMEDDLNTADAITAIFEMVTAINTYIRDDRSSDFAKKALESLLKLSNVLGLLESESQGEEVSEEIKKLVEERQLARKDKNFARADEIRDLLKAQGITLKDTPQGVQIIRD
ncbi:MAG: cysteine--tRNA ligase [Eubacteriales bacterium]